MPRDGVAISAKAGTEGLLEEVAFEQKLEKGECESQANVWRKMSSGNDNY